MRRLTGLLRALPLLAALGCASAAPLPGGPPDVEPPEVLGFTPESGTVNFRGRAVTVQFDETISDRGTGASALEALVTISPRHGAPQVSWSRSRIAVRPRDGFLPNTAYRITVGPGIADIRGNRSDEATAVIFSTGPTIPNGEIAGVAYDWPGQAFARNAQIEAVRVADSAVFITPVDSVGAFTVGPLNAGTYLVYGYVDQNRNRVRDRLEAWDSTRVTVGDTTVVAAELLLAPRDTLPARLQTVTVLDSATLMIEFDRPLDPDQPFSPEQVRVVRADSTPVGVTAVLTRAAYDSMRARAGRDTAAADTARRDTLAADTLARPGRPSRAAPPRAFAIRLAQPLTPGTTYRITVTGFRTLMGRTEPVTRTLTLPAAAPPPAARDTVPADTTRRAPPPRGRR